jgi:DNA-directed RNA polymerase subunit RPC12/RpoP
MTFGGWKPAIYRCEGCGATYETEVYGGLARDELGGATCTNCGGRYRLQERLEGASGGEAIEEP